MKDKYSRPVIVSSEAIEGDGITPLVVAGVTIKAAAALLGGFMAGRAATKIMKASPAFKMPGLKILGSDENDFCMA